MKDLKECLNESLNESLSAFAIGYVLFALLAVAESFMYNDELSKDATYTTWKQSIKHRGIILGTAAWIFNKCSDLKGMIEESGVSKQVEKIKKSKQFKAFMELPTEEQTIAKLKEVQDSVLGDNNRSNAYAAKGLWEEIKHQSELPKNAEQQISNAE